MNKFNLGIITPSYALDFERCQLLSLSIQQFISPSVTHYIIVDRRDLSLFSQLQGPNTEILTVESVLPWWIKKPPFVSNGWLSLKTPPIRNWVLQQIVKIAVAQCINKDVLVFVDSDVTFIRPFNLQSFMHKGQVRLFRIPLQMHFKEQQAANRLLGLPLMNHTSAEYIGNIITWRRDNLLKLCEKIESTSGRGWIETLCNSRTLSEYTLYGIFVDQFLKDQSGHYYDSQSICYEYWSSEAMSDEQLQNFFAGIRPNHIAVMISAKARMSVQRYQTLLKMIPAM